MNNLRSRPLPHAVARTLAVCAVLVVLLLLETSARAQQQQGNDPRDPVNQEGLNRRDMRDREAALRTKIKTERRLSENEQKLALKQINEDYERLQVANNLLLRAASGKQATDYKLISDTAAEIKKRAARLKENLSFPEPEGDEEGRKNHVAADGGVDASQAKAVEGVKASVNALDALIVSFVTNPLFQSKTPVVDARLAAKASRDLKDIIELCTNLRKNADKLNKLQKSPQ